MVSLTSESSLIQGHSLLVTELVREVAHDGVYELSVDSKDWPACPPPSEEHSSSESRTCLFSFMSELGWNPNTCARVNSGRPMMC
jgi:hypothetical protein